jgi:hypothetical protein
LVPHPKITDIKVSENKIMMRMSGSKGEELMGHRILHNEEYHNTYFNPNIIKVIT